MFHSTALLSLAAVRRAGLVMACSVFLFLSPARSLHSAEESVMVASFSTSVADQDDNIKRNIAIACERLNGSELQPGSVFSFNDTVGEGSAKNGYVMGRVLYRDRSVMEPGGGLCQVSSTLFNALLMAGCVIIERHRHFQPVAYVPLGLDATIKYGKKDLKIKNPHQNRLRIHLQMNDRSLIAVITSDRELPHRYEVYTEEEDVSLPGGESIDNVRHGISVLVYRKRYAGNRLVHNALLYKDYYPPAYIR
jgi:vancomycin resistance protein YoaR